VSGAATELPTVERNVSDCQAMANAFGVVFAGSVAPPTAWWPEPAQNQRAVSCSRAANRTGVTVGRACQDQAGHHSHPRHNHHSRVINGCASEHDHSAYRRVGARLFDRFIAS